jgi:hypothetical protein
MGLDASKRKKECANEFSRNEQISVPAFRNQVNNLDYPKSAEKIQ